MTDLFPPTPLGLANENFKCLLETLRETLKQLSRNAEVECSSPSRLAPERVPSTQHDALTCATDNVPSTSKTPAEVTATEDDSESTTSLCLPNEMTNNLVTEEVEVSSSHEYRAKALVRRAANLDAESESENDHIIGQNLTEERQQGTVSLNSKVISQYIRF